MQMLSLWSDLWIQTWDPRWSLKHFFVPLSPNPSTTDLDVNVNGRIICVFLLTCWLGSLSWRRPAPGHMVRHRTQPAWRCANNLDNIQTKSQLQLVPLRQVLTHEIIVLIPIDAGFDGKTWQSASVEWGAEAESREEEEQDTRVGPRQPGQSVRSQEVSSNILTGSQEDPPAGPTCLPRIRQTISLHMGS